MSVWGPGIFDNDDAMDWVYDLADSGSLSQVMSALDVIIKNKGDDLEISDCRIALAAAEVIAAMHGEASPDLPEEVEEWIGDDVLENESQRIKAETAVESVIKDSTLKDKWESSGNYERWRSIVLNLQKRLEY
jgi:hypothetical protein